MSEQDTSTPEEIVFPDIPCRKCDQLQQQVKELEAEAEANHIPATTMTKCKTHGTWYKPSEGCALCLKERVKALAEEYRRAREKKHGASGLCCGLREIAVKERDTYRGALEGLVEVSTDPLATGQKWTTAWEDARAALSKGEPAPRRTAPPKAGLESGICEKVD